MCSNPIGKLLHGLGLLLSLILIQIQHGDQIQLCPSAHPPGIYIFKSIWKLHLGSVWLIQCLQGVAPRLKDP